MAVGVVAALQQVPLRDHSLELRSVVDDVDLGVVVLQKAQEGEHQGPDLGRVVLTRAVSTPR